MGIKLYPLMGTKLSDDLIHFPIKYKIFSQYILLEVYFTSSFDFWSIYNVPYNHIFQCSILSFKINTYLLFSFAIKNHLNSLIGVTFIKKSLFCRHLKD